VKTAVSMYPTAVCRKCGKEIYNGEGMPNKKGEWLCNKCLENKK
jgi:formylmethanofuran dehydrogenase subunit E